MDYSGDLAAIQQRLAASRDMELRREVILEALGGRAGETVLEVGCGSGVLLKRIAREVGESGAAIGIDLSSDQVGVAREALSGLSHARVEVADARDLPLDEDMVDATVSTQVLEYIEDVDTAIDELARVTRIGGRFVNVATNWGALFWSGGDPDLTADVLRAWDVHCPHPNLPVELPMRLERSGFGDVVQRDVTIVNRRFQPDTFAWGIAHLMVAYAVEQGALYEDDGTTWIHSLEEADSEGRHFLSSVPILTVATRSEG